MSSTIRLAIMLLLGATASSQVGATLFTYEFSTTVNFVHGSPAGITAEVGTLVTGRIQYDDTTPRVSPDSSANRDRFDISIADGFRIMIGDTVLLASNYTAWTSSAFNFGVGSGDHVTFQAGMVSSSLTNEFTVDGAPYVPPTGDHGSFVFNFRNIDGTLFLDNQSLENLPSLPSILEKTDEIAGYFTESTNGVTNRIDFGDRGGEWYSPPDPPHVSETTSSLGLLSLSVAALVLARRRKK